MLPSHSLMRSPSTKILANIQRAIFAECKPLRYIEPSEEDVETSATDAEAAAEFELLMANGAPALAALHGLRAELCHGITREGRIVRGCENFLKVCKKDSVAEADAQVALSFARSRHQDLSRELHYANALFYNALTQHGPWEPEAGDTVLQGLAKLAADRAKCSLPVLAPRNCTSRSSARSSRRSSTRSSRHTSANSSRRGSLRSSGRASATSSPAPSAGPDDMPEFESAPPMVGPKPPALDIEMLRLPMVALPCKVPEKLVWGRRLKRVLTNHYLEPTNAFEAPIEQLQRARDMIVAAAVGPLGLPKGTQGRVRRAAFDDLSRNLARHIKYYHNLCSLDERFFVDGRLAGISFSWLDSLTGEHYHHDHLSYEKACVLFNAASLASQSALEEISHQDWAINRSRTFHEISAGLLELAYATMEELEAAQSPYARGSVHGAAKAAAAAATKMRETHGSARRSKCPKPKGRRKGLKAKQRAGAESGPAPNTETLGADELPQLVSTDLAGKTLHFFIILTLAQAQEEHWLTHCRAAREEGTVPYHDEALAVLQMYRGAKALLANFKQDEELPAAYFGNVYIKRDYYEACTDWCHAQMVLHGDFGETGVSAREVHRTASERLVRARMFLKRAIETCGDASNGFLKVYLPYIERLDTLVVMELKLCDSGTLTKVQAREDALWHLPSLHGSAKRWSQPINLPRLKRPLDLFASLGRLHYFNALCPLMNRRTVRVERGEEGELGFAIHGEKPVCVADVEQGSHALENGVTGGSSILKVNGQDVRLASHRQVADLLVDSGPIVILELADNYAVDEIDTEDISIDNEEDFFNKIAQVGEEAMMAMLEGEIAEDRAAANECNGAEPADTAAAAQ